MPQNADSVLDHENLFRQPEYRELLARKKEEFEFAVPLDKVQDVAE